MKGAVSEFSLPSLHHLGRKPSRFPKLRGTCCSVWVGTETIVSPGINTSSNCRPAGGVTRARQLKLLKDTGVSSKEIERIGRCGGRCITDKCEYMINGKQLIISYLPAMMRRRASSCSAISPGGADLSCSNLALMSWEMMSCGSAYL